MNDERNAPGTEEELVRAFDELLRDVPPPDTSDEVGAFLRECGYDPEGVAARMVEHVRRLSADSALNWRKSARQDLDAARARRGQRGALERGREELLAAIRALYASLSAGQRPHVPAAHFRNLDKVSDDDLASLLTDLEHLASDEE